MRAADQEYTTLAVDEIAESLHNPRSEYHQKALDELTESVRSKGVLVPILVRMIEGKPEVVYGHRRLRAARAAGLETIPAIVRELSDDEALELAIIENCTREDIAPLDEAEAYQALVKHGMKVDDLAVKVGKSRSHIYGRLKLAELPAKAKKALADGSLIPSVAVLVARLPTKELRQEVLDDFLADWRDVLSLRDATEMMGDYLLRLKDAPFDPTDLELVPGLSCSSCQKRTGAQADLFPDVKHDDVCTDRNCYDVKSKAVAKKKINEAREKGQKVLEGKAAGTARYSHDYVDPSQQCWEDPKHRTYRQLVGKLAPDPVLIVEKDQGAREVITERWPVKAVADAMKQAGHKFAKKAAHASSGMDATEKRPRAEQDRQREIDRAVMERIVDAITEDMDQREDLLRAVAGGMVRFAWADVRKTVARRRALITGKQHAGDADTALQEQAKALEYSAAIALLVELLLGHDIYENKATTKAVCAATGVDPKAIEKELLAAAKADAAAKKAAKKAKGKGNA